MPPQSVDVSSRRCFFRQPNCVSFRESRRGSAEDGQEGRCQRNTSPFSTVFWDDGSPRDGSPSLLQTHRRLSLTSSSSQPFPVQHCSDTALLVNLVMIKEQNSPNLTERHPAVSALCAAMQFLYQSSPASAALQSSLFICRCGYMTFPNAIHLHMKVPLFFPHFK